MAIVDFLINAGEKREGGWRVGYGGGGGDRGPNDHVKSVGRRRIGLRQP